MSYSFITLFKSTGLDLFLEIGYDVFMRHIATLTFLFLIVLLGTHAIA
jgi:hypothetical protein